MSGARPVVDESRYEWETLKSKNGASFRVGREKTHGVGGGDVKAAAAVGVAAEKEDFDIAVDWPVDGIAKDGTGDTKDKAAISNYCLSESITGVYNTCLEFTNTEHYNYHFYDESDDCYQLNTFRNGSHTLRYKSDLPTIKYIQGS